MSKKSDFSILKNNPKYGPHGFLLISSDPEIYSIRTRWLPKISLEMEKEDPESTEVKNLLTFDFSDYFEKNS